jgi:hypothetical protein
MGRMRSGKDTVAARLVTEFKYTRLAFADPLKGMALDLNPIVTVGAVRLAEIVNTFGWEYAKDEFAEVRRVLQHMGQSQRALDPDYWVRVLLAKVDAADRWNLPVVVSDVRYRNEADALKARGFRLVRVTRPGGGETVDAAELQALSHLSERDLARYTPDVAIYNGGSIAELHQRADALTT